MRLKPIVPIAVCLAILCLPRPGRAAVYNGQTLDGQVIPAVAFSEDKTRTSQVTVMFSGTDALITFPSHRTVTFSMDTETIADPHHLRVYNYDKQTYWDLDVVGLH